MTYRVVQCATGNVGKHALRALIERPDFELVGVRTYDPNKVGLDAGEFVGLPAVGVAFTDDLDEVLALEPDCVVHTGLGTTTNDLEPIYGEVSRILSSGANVVTTTLDYYGYPSVMVGLATHEGLGRLEAACRTGASTLFQGGVSPGWALDFWPLSMTRISRRIDHIHLTEIVDLRDYPSANILRGYMGFAQPPQMSPFLEQLCGMPDSVYYLALRMVTDSFGLPPVDATFTYDFTLAEEPFDAAIGRVEVGDVVGIDAHLTGSVDGVEVMRYRFIWKMIDREDWPTGDGRYLLRIEGDPVLESELQISTTTDTGRAVSITTAMAVVNAIPAVCAATPGIKSYFDLPLHFGGYSPVASRFGPGKALAAGVAR